MRIRVVKPSGLFWLDPPRKLGEEFEASAADGAALVAAGHAVAAEVPAVATAPVEYVEAEAPVLTAARNGSAKKWKKKG